MCLLSCSACGNAGAANEICLSVSAGFSGAICAVASVVAGASASAVAGGFASAASDAAPASCVWSFSATSAFCCCNSMCLLSCSACAIAGAANEVWSVFPSFGGRLCVYTNSCSMKGALRESHIRSEFSTPVSFSTSDNTSKWEYITPVSGCCSHW